MLDVTNVTEVNYSNKSLYNSAWFEHLVGMDVEAGHVYIKPSKAKAQFCDFPSDFA